MTSLVWVTALRSGLAKIGARGQLGGPSSERLHCPAPRTEQGAGRREARGQVQVLTLPPSWKSRLDAREGGDAPRNGSEHPRAPPHIPLRISCPLGKPMGGGPHACPHARRGVCLIQATGHPKAGRGLTQALLQDMH